MPPCVVTGKLQPTSTAYTGGSATPAPAPSGANISPSTGCIRSDAKRARRDLAKKTFSWGDIICEAFLHIVSGSTLPFSRYLFDYRQYYRTIEQELQWSARLLPRLQLCRSAFCRVVVWSDGCPRTHPGQSIALLRLPACRVNKTFTTAPIQSTPRRTFDQAS